MAATNQLISLEEKLTHLERYVGELDDVVRDLGDSSRTMREELSALRHAFNQHLADLHGHEAKGDAPDD